MVLKLIQEEVAERSFIEIEHSFYKNIIKKDIELFVWQNKAVEVFGDFQIYSDFNASLNSFEHVLMVLLKRDLKLIDTSWEAEAIESCIEYLFNMKVSTDSKMRVNQLDMVASNYTLYLISLIGLDLMSDADARIKLKELKSKFLSDNNNNIHKYLNTSFLN